MKKTTYIALQRIYYTPTDTTIEAGGVVDVSHLKDDEVQMLIERGIIAAQTESPEQEAEHDLQPKEF